MYWYWSAGVIERYDRGTLARPGYSRGGRPQISQPLHSYMNVSDRNSVTLGRGGHCHTVAPLHHSTVDGYLQ